MKHKEKRKDRKVRFAGLEGEEIVMGNGDGKKL